MTKKEQRTPPPLSNSGVNPMHPEIRPDAQPRNHPQAASRACWKRGERSVPWTVVRAISRRDSIA